MVNKCNSSNRNSSWFKKMKYSTKRQKRKMLQATFSSSRNPMVYRLDLTTTVEKRSCIRYSRVRSSTRAHDNVIDLPSRLPRSCWIRPFIVQTILLPDWTPQGGKNRKSASVDTIAIERRIILFAQCAWVLLHMCAAPHTNWVFFSFTIFIFDL